MQKAFPYSYIRKKITPTKDATISIQCKVVQYGLGCFSGIRGTWDEKEQNIYIYRLEDHHKRLKESAKIVGMKFNLTYPKFKKIIIKLVKKNKAKGDIYIRPTLYSASTELTPRFDNPDDDLAIYIIPLKDYFNTAKGLNVCISSWRRFDDAAISVKAKITGSYANSALAKTEAKTNGYDEAILLNRDGKICEASGANIFAIKNGELYTPPLGSNNLGGITRNTIIEFAEKELNIRVRKEEIDRSMLYAFDELFFTGTAAKVSWVKSVDKRVIGTGKIGKTTKKLKNLFDAATKGKLIGYEKWLTKIY